VGIAEQNLFGIAAGMALEGMVTFPSTFAVFASRRALDQIAISICFPKLNVKIPGSYAGIPTSRAGASHNSIEDLAIMRAMPHLRVADAGSNEDLRQIMYASMECDGPVYFRITRYTVPELFDNGKHSFNWGKGEKLREGSDVSLFGTGVMSYRCLGAANLLEKEGIKAEVIHLASIKPIDKEMILASVRKTGCAVTSENASIKGGFGDAVLEVLAEDHAVPCRKIGVKDAFIESGGVEELFTHYQMQPSDIAEAAIKVIEKKYNVTT
jgi:transketolase